MLLVQDFKQDLSRQAPTNFALATIPFELYLNHIYFQATVNGSAPLWFILDSGATITLISQNVAASSKLQVQATSAQVPGATPIEITMATDVAVNIGQLEVIFPQLMVTDVPNQIATLAGRRADGIMGYELLSRYVVEIDYAVRQFHLYDPASFHLESGFGLIPMRVHNNHAHIDASITMPGHAPIPADLIVDTGGSNELTLATPFVEKHGLLHEVSSMPFLLGGVFGLVPAKMARIAQLEFSDFEAEGFIAVFAQSRQDIISDYLGADGVLGAEILRRYTVIWNSPQQYMALKPNKHLHEPYIYDLSGLTLIAEGAGLNIFKIEGIAEATPAAQVDLQKGDILLAVDGKAAVQMTLEQLLERFSIAGKCRLTVQRGRQKLEIELQLTDTL